ncbi:MAG: nickel/cobalt transporter [Beijerinckiaceae bacterium]
MRYSRRTILLALVSLLAVVTIILLPHADALAQGRNPFSVGISEGGGAPGSALTRWILAKQVEFQHSLSAAVRAIKADGHAVWTLMGIAFAYGVFHAAGPGHGKAVIASYLIANEQALKRGLALSLLAALLQGIVAIAIVGVLAVVLQATSARMRSAANFVEVASYAAVALLGAWLVWRKGRALFGFSNGHRHERAPARDDSHNHGNAHTHTHTHAHTLHHAHDHAHAHAHAHAQAGPPHGEPGHIHDEHCGHFHAPDPKTLGEGFTWGAGIATIFAAGLRPCSGAILVLVFALAQGIFLAGVAATFAMSMGTAMTTGALAALAVLAKGMAVRFAEGREGGIFARLRVVPLLEFIAALLVLALGVLLFLGAEWN